MKRDLTPEQFAAENILDHAISYVLNSFERSDDGDDISDTDAETIRILEAAIDRVEHGPDTGIKPTV